MDTAGIIGEITKVCAGGAPFDVRELYPDEIHVKAAPGDFQKVCLSLHKAWRSPVMMLFAADERPSGRGFVIRCVFLNSRHRKWVIVAQDVLGENPSFNSLSRAIYSASLFEREIREMFGIEPQGHPDVRRLALHDEVWPDGWYPLRKDFKKDAKKPAGAYVFGRVEGEGIFEVPVGPVHAGIIGSGHFRFSVAGEPIINLELRLGFTHRGVEKLFEGKKTDEAVFLAEVVCGDASFAHSLAFTRAVEKIGAIAVPREAEIARAVFLELERLVNHMNDIAGIALDVGFSFPSALATVIKENLLELNEKLSGSRYLRKINRVGGVSVGIDETGRNFLSGTLDRVERDFRGLRAMLENSVSFMDRVDTTGVLRRKTAEDIGIVGVAARASGIAMDLRGLFGGVWDEVKFKIAVEQSGDVLSRLRVRFFEFQESTRMIKELVRRTGRGQRLFKTGPVAGGGALGYAEGWRGPVLYWVKTDAAGTIERCKVVDPSFHNWSGLSFAVLGNIIPDFPVCNKSFDLSYAGNDL